jgi:hypothetical protein
MMSVCIFGSQARSTADALSDRDVLLIGSSSTSLDQAIARWTANAWNVSVFDRPAFTRMAEVRSLFIQHLKQEGRILCDADGFLASTLEQYTPKADYSAERNDALRQIAGLPVATGAYWSDLCLADIVYVLFRNAAILHLACSREYCFQYEMLTGRMANLFALSVREQACLLALRGLKHGYRRRESDLPAERWVAEAQEVVDRIVTRLPDLVPSSIVNGDTTDDYYELRLYELELVRRIEPGRLDAMGPDDNLFAVWQQIRRAGPYPRPRVRAH